MYRNRMLVNPLDLETLTQDELVILSRKMARVMNNPSVPGDSWMDAEEIYRDVAAEAIRRWNQDRWSE